MSTTSRRPSTQFGEPLHDESLRLVRDVRRQLTMQMHPNFDSDFNVYRFVANAERTQKQRKEVVESAARALDQHLRVRKCLRLDELPNIPFAQNRLFQEHYMPNGPIQEDGVTDSHNRLLWFIEYRSLSVETIAHGIRSSESIRCQFWQFEHMLRRVRAQEERTGRLSSIRHIVDMAGYEINPFTMIFVSSGTLSYYSQLLHYDNYPELVYPIEMVNIARWIQIPYRLIKGMMPAGFTDRFRLHDDNFLGTLAREIPLECIPHTLGGQNQSFRCVPARRLQPNEYWHPGANAHLLEQLETIHIGPRKSKCFRIQIAPGSEQHSVRHVLSWYFRTDGDIYFGLFHEPWAAEGTGEKQQDQQQQAVNGDGQQQQNGHSTSSNGLANGDGHGPAQHDNTNNTNNNHHQHHFLHNKRHSTHHQYRHNLHHKEAQQHHSPPTDVDQMETGMDWCYPWFKLTAKIHHEWDCVDCTRAGTYWLVFSNRQSWLHRRSVDVMVHLSRVPLVSMEQQNGTSETMTKRLWHDGEEEELCIMEEQRGNGGADERIKAAQNGDLDEGNQLDLCKWFQMRPEHMFGPVPAPQMPPAKNILPEAELAQ